MELSETWVLGVKDFDNEPVIAHDPEPIPLPFLPPNDCFNIRLNVSFQFYCVPNSRFQSHYPKQMLPSYKSIKNDLPSTSS
jgi:hypothetical protein